MVVVMLMVFTVNVLLLYAAGQLLGGNGNPVRIFGGAFLGALFVAFSMVPGFQFLGNFLWRLCSLALSALLTFGFSKATLPKLLLFSLLHLSLEGIAGEENEMLSMLLGAAGIGFACLAVGKRRDFIPVELRNGDQTLHITALRDTGNTLHDPITGKPVLIVGADVAGKLTGLTPAALQDPVRTIGSIPGLRLIPYQTVGNTGFLLALRIPDVKIGNRQGSTLVAFSPLVFGGNYQALTGGTI